MNQGSHGGNGAPGATLEKRATSTITPRSGESLRMTSSDHTSGSSDVPAQPARSSASPTLDRIARVPVVERAVDFGGEARQRAEQRIATQPVEHALPLALAGDKPGSLQHRKVARHRGSAHAEAIGEVGGRERSLREERDDLASRQRRQGVEHPLRMKRVTINKHANSMADEARLCLESRRPLRRTKRCPKAKLASKRPARPCRWPTVTAGSGTTASWSNGARRPRTCSRIRCTTDSRYSRACVPTRPRSAPRFSG